MTPPSISNDPTPSLCPVAFKEWAGVCRALADGRQSILLRKGGIDEGPGGFRPEHPAFWLYPTHLHEAQQGLRDEADAPLERAEAPAGMLELPALAVVEAVAWADRLELLGLMADLHVWAPETIDRRFHYKRPGLWVVAVRVLRAEPPPRIAIEAEHAGCRTWVPLLTAPEPPGTLRSTLDPDVLERRVARVRRLSDRGNA